MSLAENLVAGAAAAIASEAPEGQRPPVGTCSVCGNMHAYPAERFECSGCGRTLCAAFGFDGKPFGRKGQRVHVQLFQKEGKPATKRPCGTLRPLQVEEVTRGEETAPEAGAAIAGGEDLPRVREDVPAEQAEPEALPPRVPVPGLEGT